MQKSKETSSQLAKKIAGYTLYWQQWLLFVSIYVSTIPAEYVFTCAQNAPHSLANLQDLIHTLIHNYDNTK